MAKSREAFRTISEVAEWLDTPAHVLRFWESKFSQVKPVKRAGGRRYYRPGDMELLGGIKKLLHEDGMTIKGVQKILREQGVRHVAGLSAHLSEGDGATIEDAPYTEVDIDDHESEVVSFPSEETQRRQPTRTEPHTPDLFADLDAVHSISAESDDLIDMEDDPWLGTPRAPEDSIGTPQVSVETDNTAENDMPLPVASDEGEPQGEDVELGNQVSEPETLSEAVSETELAEPEVELEVEAEEVLQVLSEPPVPDEASDQVDTLVFEQPPSEDLDVPADALETPDDSLEVSTETETETEQDPILLQAEADTDQDEVETPPRSAGVLTLLSKLSPLSEQHKQDLLPHLVAVRSLAQHYQRPTQPLD